MTTKLQLINIIIITFWKIIVLESKSSLRDERPVSNWATVSFSKRCLLQSVTCSPFALHNSTARDTNPTLCQLSISACGTVTAAPSHEPLNIPAQGSNQTAQICVTPLTQQDKYKCLRVARACAVPAALYVYCIWTEVTPRVLLPLNLMSAYITKNIWGLLGTGDLPHRKQCVTITKTKRCRCLEEKIVDF